MRKSVTVTLLLVLFASLGRTTWGEGKTTPLKLTVMEAVVTPDGVLHCKWKMHNAGKEVIHVYAPFLYGPSDDMLDITRGGTALVRTTWLREIKAYPAYYFPKPEFIDVAPGAEITGALDRSPQAKQKAIKLQKLRIVVGYGSDTDKLNSDVQQSLTKGTEFQANAVIRWQSLAYSAPVDVVQQ